MKSIPKMTLNSSRTALAAALVAVSVVSIAPEAEASRGRRVGLTGNLLLEDDTDVYLFPGTLFGYGQQFDVDIAEQPTASARLLLSDELVLGVAANRTQQLNNIDALDDLALYLSQRPAIKPTELGTVMLGWESGFGLRTSVTYGTNTTTVEADKSTENGWTALGIEFGAGYSQRDDDSSYDLAAALRFNSVSERNGDEVVFSSEGLPAISLGARGKWDSAREWLDWSALGSLGFHDFSIKKLNRSATVFRVGAGPLIHAGRHVDLAATGSLSLGYLSNDPSGSDNNAASLGLGFPGFDLSVDYRALRWLSLRWGFKHRFVLQADGQEIGDGDVSTVTVSQGDSTFGAGVGVHSWDFVFDVGVEGDSGIGSADTSKVVASLVYRPSEKSLTNPPEPYDLANDPYAIDRDADSTVYVMGGSAAMQQGSVGSPAQGTTSEATGSAAVSPEPREIVPQRQTPPPPPPPPAVTEDTARTALQAANDAAARAASVALDLVAPADNDAAQALLKKARDAMASGDYASVVTAAKAAERAFADAMKKNGVAP